MIRSILLCILLSSCVHQKTPVPNVHYKDIAKDIEFITPASGYHGNQYETIRKHFPIRKNYKGTVPYNAGDDKDRFNSLKRAIYGNKKYIWCCKGGYGSARLFKFLNNITLPNSQKVIIGYSDITFLHIYLNNLGWKTIHGAMPVDAAKKDPCNITKVKDMIKSGKGTVIYEELIPLNKRAKNSKIVKGKITGGNLTIITNSLATKWQIDGKDKIILIEDTGAQGYVIDRDLNHLMQAGVFNKAAAVIFGTFSNAGPHKQYAINRFAKSVNIPVYESKYFGHGYHNYPVPFGFIAKITPTKNKDYKISINYNFN